jgi:dihydrofolate reductase
MSQTGSRKRPRVGSPAPRVGHGDAPYVAPAPLLCIIAAVASNGVIGAGGKLPWHLGADLRFFREQTMGHPVIMGRRTWESIGKPLPGRRNIVITRNPAYRPQGVDVADSLATALARCAGENAVFVIGGGDLYGAALALADRLLLTEIHSDFDGDVRFPEFDRAQWKETRREPQTTEDGLRFDFVRYERVR